MKATIYINGEKVAKDKLKNIEIKNKNLKRLLTQVVRAGK